MPAWMDDRWRGHSPGYAAEDATMLSVVVAPRGTIDVASSQVQAPSSSQTALAFQPWTWRIDGS